MSIPPSGMLYSNPRGWVERRETHLGRFQAAALLMGFAALNPSYEGVNFFQQN
jgi:hypothetical protein